MSLLLLIILIGLFGLLIAFCFYLNNELDERDKEIKVLHQLVKESKYHVSDAFDRSTKNHASQAKYDALQKQYDELHINVVDLRKHITRLKKSKDPLNNSTKGPQ